MAINQDILKAFESSLNLSLVIHGSLHSFPGILEDKQINPRPRLAYFPPNLLTLLTFTFIHFNVVIRYNCQLHLMCIYCQSVHHKYKLQNIDSHSVH